MDRKWLRIFTIVFVIIVLVIAFLLLKLSQSTKLINQTDNTSRSFTSNPINSSSVPDANVLAKNNDNIFMIQGTFASKLRVEGGTVVGDFTPDGKTGTLRAIFTTTDGTVSFGHYQPEKTVFQPIKGSDLVSQVNPGSHYELRIATNAQQKDITDQVRKIQKDNDISGKNYYVVTQTIAELQ